MDGAGTAVDILNTAGHGGLALIRFKGEVLSVMDDWSYMPAESVDLSRPFFSVMTRALDWASCFDGNSTSRRALEAVNGWTYLGWGQIMSIQPTVVDFGILTLEVDLFTHDTRCIGAWVRIPLDRLDLTFGAKTGGSRLLAPSRESI